VEKCKLLSHVRNQTEFRTRLAASEYQQRLVVMRCSRRAASGRREYAERAEAAGAEKAEAEAAALRARAQELHRRTG